MHHLLDHVHIWYKGQTVPSLLPCAQATWAIFADWGSDEGTVDFKRQTNTWACFENSQPIKQLMEEPGPPPRIRDQAPHMERYDRQMAESCTWAAYRSPHAWMSGLPTQVQNKPEETLDFRNNKGAEENQQNHGSMELWGLSQHDHTSNLSPAPLIRPMYIMLDQDYARCLMSAQSHQMVGPIAISGSTQRQSVAMTTPSMPIQGQVGQNTASIVLAMTILGESDHEITMIDALRNHIRDLLMGILNNLPEIKGLQAKLPEAYDSEDNFDHLDRWLQGLLRFFKIHCLTGADKDIDWVLVTGACLKGKAEWWFSHEVECPNCRTRDWTFELVIIALYCAFITTTMAQKAMEKYLNVKYSKVEDILGFHCNLVMWAGQLAQHPDDYSFKWRIMNGLPSDCLYHLAMYDKLTAKHSSIEDIMQQA